jgi:hypothetical protein
MFSFPRLKLKFLVKVDLRRSECPVTAIRSELSLSTELLIGDDKLICHICLQSDFTKQDDSENRDT